MAPRASRSQRQAEQNCNPSRLSFCLPRCNTVSSDPLSGLLDGEQPVGRKPAVRLHLSVPPVTRASVSSLWTQILQSSPWRLPWGPEGTWEPSPAADVSGGVLCSLILGPSDREGDSQPLWKLQEINPQCQGGRRRGAGRGRGARRRVPEQVLEKGRRVESKTQVQASRWRVGVNMQDSS